MTSSRATSARPSRHEDPGRARDRGGPVPAPVAVVLFLGIEPVRPASRAGGCDQVPDRSAAPPDGRAPTGRVLTLTDPGRQRAARTARSPKAFPPALQEATVADIHPHPTQRDHTASSTAQAGASSETRELPRSGTGRRAGSERPTRERAAVEEDLRGISAMRARLRTGDRRADRLFAEMIDRRVDRLLDELLLHLGTTETPRRPAEPASTTSRVSSHDRSSHPTGSPQRRRRSAPGGDDGQR
jgi:hypothetical protein